MIQQGDGFDFPKDFVLKSALVLSDITDIGFSVENFGRENTKTIESGWEKNVRAPLQMAVEVAAALGYHDKTLTSNNVLIPVAYWLKKMGCPAGFVTAPKYIPARAQIRSWLIAGLLKSVFSSKTDTLLSAVRTAIRDSSSSLFPMKDIEAALNEHGVSLRFSDVELESLLEAEYGKRNAFSVLAALYPGLNMQFRFHMDHVFPKSGFHAAALKKAGFSAEAIERMKTMVNQIPNLQLLEGLTNQSKLDATFDTWISPMKADPNKWNQYRAQHLIPDMEGYPLAGFEAFFESRRQLMLARLREKLAAPVEAGED